MSTHQSRSGSSILHSLVRPFRRRLLPRRPAPLVAGGLRVEPLEDRCLLSVNFLPRVQAPKPLAVAPHAVAPHATPHAAAPHVKPHKVSPTYILTKRQGQVAPQSGPGPSGYSPAQLLHAYGFDQISFGGVKGDGTGQTIAIVDAFDDPALVSSTSPAFLGSDLHKFDLAFGLPDPVFTKVNQTGGSTPPAPDSGWAVEIALDVEWAHAIAPKANILLVEANTSNDSDMDPAVAYAASQPGVSAVSMSWGEGEFFGETGEDGFFTTPSGHAGVTFIAASGDTGAPPIYPSVSPNVLAVGGTRLSLDGSGNILGESGWGGSGGGISGFEGQPSYQAGAGTGSTQRTTPDVAYNADPGTGVPVLDSYTYGSAAPWQTVGGTSAAAPQWAALLAIVNQGRALAGEASLDGPSQTLPYLYSLSAVNFHDITTGGSTGSPPYSAKPGYDYVTGRGSPVANLLVPSLVGSAVQVLDGSRVVPKGGSVSLTAFVGALATHTFTVTNVGGATLTLSDPIALPGGFTLASDFGSTTLAPGASTTFVVQVNTSVAATYSGAVSFGTSDPANNPYLFTLTATVIGSVIIDNGQAGYSDAGGGWLSWSGPGYYNNNARYAPAGAGANTATWTFSGLPDGWYTVQADWAGYSGHASNATYSIAAGGATSTAVADQRPASSGPVVGGVGFQTLATVYVTGGTATVTLSDKADGILVADAVRVAAAAAPTTDLNWSGGGLSGLPATVAPGTPFTVTRSYTITGGAVPEPFTIGYYASPDGKFSDATLLASEAVPAGAAAGTYTGSSPPLQFGAAGTYYLLARLDDGDVVQQTDETNDVSAAAGPVTVSAASSVVIDNGQAGYSDAGGGWLSWSGPGYYNNNARYAPAGAGANTATWTFSGLADGWYTVQADWAGYSGHASNATYSIMAGGTTSTAVADQRPASSGPVVGGVGFQTLATVYVTGGTATVTLSDKADGILVADAVRVAAAAAPTTDLNWSGGGLSGLPATVAPGTPFTVTRSYAVTGGSVPEPFTIGYYASPDGKFSDATLLASEAVPAGAAAGTYTGSSPPLQFGAAGTFYLLARLDDGDVVQQTDETNDVSPAAGPVTVSAASSVIIDNGQAGYSDAGGGWLSWSGPGYYNNNARYAFAGAGANVATWAFAGLTPGTYQVQADWAGYSGHASNATYSITAGGATSTAVADQRPASSGTAVGGVGFQTLATVTVGGDGSLSVTLSDKADGIVVADAVRVLKVG